MSLDIPEDWIETGRIEIIIGSDSTGPTAAYGFEGIDAPAAIGHLTTVLDAIRESQKGVWTGSADRDTDEEDDYEDDEVDDDL